MEYRQTWKEKVTPAGRSLSVHTASGRPISDKEFTGWATVTTSDDAQNMEKRALRGKKWGFGTALSLGTAVRLTGYTPRATDGTNGGPNQAGGALSHDVQLTGGEKTPQASDGQGGVMEIRPGTTGKYKLRDFAHLAGWPTAQTHDVTTRGNTMADGHTKPHDLSNAAAEWAGWPTTTTRDSESEGKDGENRTGSPSLPALVRGVITELFLVPTGRRVVLAPEFSLWLMGFPEAWVTAAPGAKDWLEAQAALELECSKDRETPSSPPSPPSSSEPI